jgi:hypothetical protein
MSRHKGVKPTRAEVLARACRRYNKRSLGFAWIGPPPEVCPAACAVDLRRGVIILRSRP